MQKKKNEVTPLPNTHEGSFLVVNADENTAKWTSKILV